MDAEIRLTRGRVALVDQEDYERLAGFTWLAFRDHTTGRIYAGRWSRKKEEAGRGKFMIPMHEEVMGKLEGFRIDHIRTEQTLDNRRANLRRATASQNAANRGIPKHNTSGFKGVSFDGCARKWRATIKVDRKQKWLGYHKDKEAAARAYDKAASELFGEFAYLNFPKQAAA